MADVQVNYPVMEQLIVKLDNSSFQFSDAAYHISGILTLVHDDGLEGKAGKQLLDSLRGLQKKLKSAGDLFDNLAKEVNKATEEMRERDNAAKF